MEDYLSLENRLYARGLDLIAGVDESGRGPLAGPVVCAAVIFKRGQYPPGIRDSKKCTPRQRDILFYRIRRECLCYALGLATHRRIDQINIRQATFEAMNQAVSKLAYKPDLVLVDGPDSPLRGVGQQALVGGDRRSISIAAASILAKVVRDRMMVYYDRLFPGYNFRQNKGYASREHREILIRRGRCPLHRRSFNFRV